MKYCTWKENGMSFIFEDGYISYMGENVFNAVYKEPIKSQIIIQEF